MNEYIVKLKESFNRHGLKYRLLKRNNRLAIFGVSGTFTDEFLHYEVMFIRLRDDKFGYREAISSDEQFGKSKPDRHFQKVDEALSYFNEWTAKLMQGVKEKDEKVVIHQQMDKPLILDESS